MEKEKRFVQMKILQGKEAKSELGRYCFKENVCMQSVK